MSGSVVAFFVGSVIFFVIFCVYAAMTIISRLSNMEHNSEKTALLLTVLANKQGATQEDINKAVNSEPEAAPASKEAPPKGGKKK